MTEQQLCAVMETYGDTVYRLAVCRLQSAADAEDVYQDVFLRLFEKKSMETADPQYLKAWLIRTTINRCTDIMRFRLRRGTVSLESLCEVAACAEDRSAPELWQAVGSLPPKFRVVVHLHYAEGYSTDEIAAILAIPAVTVRTRLRRARLKLKDMLGGNENE